MRNLVSHTVEGTETEGCRVAGALSVAESKNAFTYTSASPCAFLTCGLKKGAQFNFCLVYVVKYSTYGKKFQTIFLNLCAIYNVSLARSFLEKCYLVLITFELHSADINQN